MWQLILETNKKINHFKIFIYRELALVHELLLVEPQPKYLVWSPKKKKYFQIQKACFPQHDLVASAASSFWSNTSFFKNHMDQKLVHKEQ